MKECRHYHAHSTQKNPNRNTNFFFSHSSILHMTTLLVFFSLKNSMPCVLTIDHSHFYSFFIYTYQLNFLFSSPYKPFHPLFLPTDPFSFPCFFSRFVPFFFSFTGFNINSESLTHSFSFSGSLASTSSVPHRKNSLLFW